MKKENEIEEDDFTLENVSNDIRSTLKALCLDKMGEVDYDKISKCFMTYFEKAKDENLNNGETVILLLYALGSHLLLSTDDENVRLNVIQAMVFPFLKSLAPMEFKVMEVVKKPNEEDISKITFN